MNHEKGPEVTSFVTNENYFATALTRYVLDNEKKQTYIRLID